MSVLLNVRALGVITVTSNCDRARYIVGIASDMLSPSVLTLGLRARGDDPNAHLLRAMKANSEPAALTLSQLKRWPLSLRGHSVVYVFENPSILAQAARGGWQDPPLVCSSGQPNVAVLTLLRQFRACGVKVRVHCDFDSKGLEITRLIIKRVGATPWKMQMEDYVDGLGSSSIEIIPPVPNTSWDSRLSERMQAENKAVFEEDIRDSLIAALRPGQGNGRRSHI